MQCLLFIQLLEMGVAIAAMAGRQQDKVYATAEYYSGILFVVIPYVDPPLSPFYLPPQRTPHRFFSILMPGKMYTLTFCPVNNF